MERRGLSGYMTVSVALVLLLAASLCLTLIEGTRRNTAALVAECAMDAGMNSILAEYHRELYRQYGLFFVDTSYGTDRPGYKNTLEHLRDYMSANLGQQEKLLDSICKDFIALDWEEGEVLGVSVSSDAGGSVLRRQTSAYMKERLGITYLEEVLGWLNVVETHRLNDEWYGDMREDAERSLREWSAEENSKNNKENSKNEQGELSYYSDLLIALQEGVLKLMLGVEHLSEATVAGEIYLSERERIQGTGMNPAISFSDSDTDRLLFGKYILEKTGHYGAEKTGSRLRYQTEYVLYGRDSDVGNLSEMVNRLLALREAANAVHILANQEKMDFLKPIADGIASALGVPEISPAVLTLLITLWAGFEALWDVNRLLEGEKIALLKNETQWHYAISTVDVDAEPENPLLLGYEDYLELFLLLQDKQQITYRLMDIMEMDIRLTPGNAGFRMDGCVDSVTVRADLKSDYGYRYSLTRTYGY